MHYPPQKDRQSEKKGMTAAMEHRKTALITGATGGIGRALCGRLARLGYDLILTGRNPSRLRWLARQLEAAYGVEVRFIGADLGIKGAARELCARLDRMGARVDVLINNAGFGLGGGFVNDPPDVQREMLYVDIHAVTDLCRHFLPKMLERGRGRILNVASIGAFVPGANNAVYCAAKAYVLSLSLALAEECRGTGVSVTALCPGATHTGFARRARLESSLLFHLGVMSPARVADEACRGMLQGRKMVIPGLQNKVFNVLCRLAPRELLAWVAGLAQRQGMVEESDL